MRLLESAGAAALVLPFLVATGAALAAPDQHAPEVFRFADPAIVESSGLALDDGLLVTTNDSGDVGRVFAVDPRSGRTVGVTAWSRDPVDVEALAPGAPGWVWVADIGDNSRRRGSVQVARVPVGRVTRTVSAPAYDLVHPGGPQDAEALLAHPESGRLFLVTKSVFGGTVLAAPRHLVQDEENRLRPVGRVLGMVTDGAFTPDGRHVVLRTYTRAAVYTFPELELVGQFDLPDQPQGEGLAVAEDGTLWLSTEGVGTAVRRVEIPAGIRAVMALPAPGTSSPGASSPGASSPDAEPDADSRAAESASQRNGANDGRATGAVALAVTGGLLVVAVTVAVRKRR